VTEIGFNLQAVSYWSTENPFIDRVHTSAGWVAWDTAGKVISTPLTEDVHGNVTNYTGISKIGISIELDPLTAPVSHQYVLTYDGTASVSLAGAKIISQTAGKVVFESKMNTAAPGIPLYFTGLNASNPLTNVHVVRTDQVDLFHAGEIFNPDFVAKVSQWGLVRFMDWGNTNGSQAVSWSTHATVGDNFWSYQTHADGVPLEAMVKLANEAHVDMWYNVPTKADNTYVQNALTYIRDHLDPSLKVNVEWSNEVWNTGFSANAYAKSQGAALWGTSVNANSLASVYYGYRSAQIADIAHKVFTGTHAAQLKDVLAGQSANAIAMADWQTGIAKAGFGSASTLFKEYAIAPYFGGQMGGAASKADTQIILGWAKGGQAGLDAAFHELEFGGSLSADGSMAKVMQNIARSGQIAKANGLELVAYEGGLGVSTIRWAAADKPTVQDLFNRMLADPRMGDLYTKEIAAFKAAGGTTFAAFGDTGAPNDFGSWGALNSIYSAATPRYSAILAAGGTTVPVGSTGTTTPVGSSTGTSGTSTTGTSTGGVTHTASETLPAASGHITGTAGDDHLLASVQNDTVDGSDGNDVITGSSSSVDAHGHFIEADVYMGGAGADTISGGDGNDHIYGNELTTVSGSVDGADSLSGGAGMDYIQGNAGNDTIDGGAGADHIYGGAGDDSLLGGDGDDYVQGNKGNDVLSGGSGADVLHGGADNDMVRGDAGNDQLFGDAGNDTLVGGAGADALSGGAGNDTFVFNGHDAAFVTGGLGAWVTDEVTDFSHGSDRFQLDFHPVQVLGGAAASAAAALTLANSLLGAHASSADVAAVTVGNDTYLFWDAAGPGGVADSAVKIDHVHDTFTLADFA